MRKICLISPSLHQGGLENAVIVLANEMASRGYEVSILCVYNNPIFYASDKSIKIILPSYNRQDYSSFSYYWKSVWFIRKHIKSISPDVIISYGDYINIISILATRKLKIPIYISDRASPGLQFHFLVRQLRKRLYPLAQGIIAQTQRAKEQKQIMLGEKYDNIKVIPNPIRPITTYEALEKENVILGVGRHYHVKGLDRLITVFSQLEENNWKLQIAGDYGPQTQDLKDLLKRLKIEDKVELLGPVKEIDKVFSQAKIFVLPSRSEGFPNALIEAMAHGLACISFDVLAGPAEIIKHDVNGILIEDADVDSMKNSLNNLMQDEDLRRSLGEEAFKLKEELSVKRIGDMFLDFIDVENLA